MTGNLGIIQTVSPFPLAKSTNLKIVIEMSKPQKPPTSEPLSDATNAIISGNNNQWDDDNFQYEEIALEPENDEEMLDAFSALQHEVSSPKGKQNPMNDSTTSVTHVRPSVVDDFIRNFLVKAGMKKSLEIFNTEWYELLSKGRLPAELSSPVPDIYLRNEELDQQTRQLREQVEKMREVANKAQATWDKFRKERDFHRMHHQRVIQEKNKLVDDIRRLRNHMRSYEPAIEELKRRHETAMKEKMLIRLERDRLKARVKALEEQVLAFTQPKPEDDEDSKQKRSAMRTVRKYAVFPPDDPVANPFLSLEFDTPSFEMFQTKKTYKGHVNAVSSVAFHPKKSIFATASDDETWRLWTFPDCELVMSGEGHTSWLSGIHFHPHGSHLATSSGDGTIKIWEFAQAKCTHTFTDHTQAVWNCEFHQAGDFVVSCSMDHTARIWDLISGKCKQTLRGHVDSVNAVTWQPYSANVCTASGDKTISVWDGRTGLCAQTLYGHANSCNHLAITNRGDQVISADADGIVKIWDIRMVTELGTIEVGQYPVNQLSIDRGGSRAIAACDDGSLKILDMKNFQVVSEWTGHEGAAQSISIAPNDAFAISGSSDCTFRIWGK
jgi:sperm-associated antigen 16 protein